MFSKKLISLGLAVLMTATTTTTSVFAADFKISNANNTAKQLVLRLQKPDKKDKDQKNNGKNYRFKDSSEVSWALEAIEKLAAKGILSGKTADSFRPKDNLSELEALAMILKLTGDSQTAEINNTTVHPLYKGSKLPWGLGYIFVAIEKKIILPEELSGFNPSAPAKRHTVAKYLVRALDKTEQAEDYMNKELSFKDKNAVPKSSVGYVYLVNELGLMTGNSKNEFKPMDTITRAEMAVILDRADGKVDLPDTDTRKSNVQFVSYNDSNDTITVKVKGTTTVYKVHADAPVYMNSRFEFIDDLESGDLLKLTFNQSKQIIFIEVIGHKDTTDDSDDNDETLLDIDAISYSNLPEALQEQVDYLKLSKSYKAYEYDDEIYLIATRGKKSTGGYDIDITEASKVELGSNKYNIKAVVETSDPASGDTVTQAITYPYSVVKLDDFSGIQKIIFVDKNGNKLAETSIADLNETVEIKGTIQSVDVSGRKIKVLKDNGTTTTYTIPSDADIEIDNEDVSFSSLKANMKVTIEMSDNRIIRVEAENAVTTIECTIVGINLVNTKTITVKTGSTFKTYNVNSDTKVIIDGSTSKLENLTLNSAITLTFKNGVLVEIEKE